MCEKIGLERKQKLGSSLILHRKRHKKEYTDVDKLTLRFVLWGFTFWFLYCDTKLTNMTMRNISWGLTCQFPYCHTNLQHDSEKYLMRSHLKVVMVTSWQYDTETCHIKCHLLNSKPRNVSWGLTCQFPYCHTNWQHDSEKCLMTSHLKVAMVTSWQYDTEMSHKVSPAEFQTEATHFDNTTWRHASWGLSSSKPIHKVDNMTRRHTSWYLSFSKSNIKYTTETCLARSHLLVAML